MPGYTPEKRPRTDDSDEEYENPALTSWFCFCGLLEWLSVLFDIAAVVIAVLYLV